MVDDLLVARGNEPLPDMVLRGVNLPRRTLVHVIAYEVDRTVDETEHRAAGMRTADSCLNVAVNPVARYALRDESIRAAGVGLGSAAVSEAVRAIATVIRPKSVIGAERPQAARAGPPKRPNATTVAVRQPRA